MKRNVKKVKKREWNVLWGRIQKEKKRREEERKKNVLIAAGFLANNIDILDILFRQNLPPPPHPTPNKTKK